MESPERGNSAMRPNVPNLPSVILLAAASAMAFIGLRLHRPPEPLPAGVSGDAFSGDRALRHVRAIAREPRPAGSAENARVRDYLAAILGGELGLKVERQEGTVVSDRGGKAPAREVPLENIYARLPGSQPGPGILLVAHHDSVSAGPGAADNAASVAAVLETLRALTAAGPPVRDVCALFADGEELGMLGAKMFVRDQLPKHRPAVVLNFDARGVAGPLFLYETEGANAGLVAVLARESRLPIGSSLGDFVYRRMPNNTDFSVFRRLGIPGMNFAFYDGAGHYHRPTDTPEHLDPRSLQHTGETMLGLARRMAWDRGETWAASNGNSVYFNLVGPLLVHYPLAVARINALLLLAAAMVLLGRSFRAPRTGIKPLARAALETGFILILAGGLGIAVSLTARRPGFGSTAAFSAAIVLTIVFALLGRRRFEPSIAPGALWIGGAILAGIFLPEGSYLLQWPALLIAAAACFRPLTPDDSVQRCRQGNEAVVWLAPEVRPRHLGRHSISNAVTRSVHPRGILLTGAALLAVLVHAPSLYYLFVALPAAAPVLTILAALDALLLGAAARELGAGAWRATDGSSQARPPERGS